MPIENRNVRWWVLLLVTAILLYLCWRMVQPFLNVILWATVLVILFYPAHRRLLLRIKNPSLTALVSCLLVILIILVPVGLITLAVVNELYGAALTVQAAIDYMLDPNSRVTGPILNFLSRYIDINHLRSEAFLAERLRGISGQLAGRTLGFIGGLVGAIIQTFFTIFTMYYLFRDGENISRTVRDSLPLERDQADSIMTRTREVIDASVYGVITIAAIQGTLGGLAFWVLGVQSAIIWAVVMMFLSMVPMLGAFIVWVPAAIYLALTGHWVKALVLAAWGTLVIGMIDNFLRPKLVGSRTRLHELLIFFSVLGGLNVFGVLGVVLGPVVLALTLSLIDVYRTAGRSSVGSGTEFH
ncbi:MAG TPA: AI-2E family transporter [Pyrinomonadaceae bacterium]|nr:AI-2E family transporter [Pyrinomonadaceae bacterium]